MKFLSFNSIVVRLKVALVKYELNTDSGFNSIVVRLKGVDFGAQHLDRFEFQFHSGSIKSPAVEPKAYALTAFQFHSGSIKRTGSHAKKRGFNKFQFHSGSIKRLRARA